MTAHRWMRLALFTLLVYVGRLTVVRRRALLRRIADAATINGLVLEQVREGANHTIFAVGDFQFSVPRHREINEYTAQAIMKDLADQLGKDWWRR